MCVLLNESDLNKILCKLTYARSMSYNAVESFWTIDVSGERQGENNFSFFRTNKQILNKVNNEQIHQFSQYEKLHLYQMAKWIYLLLEMKLEILKMFELIIAAMIN